MDDGEEVDGSVSLKHTLYSSLCRYHLDLFHRCGWRGGGEWVPYLQNALFTAIITCTVWAAVTGVDGGEDMDGFQAFEVLQQWTPNSSTAFFITQPHLTTSTAAVSVGGATSTSGLSADHIIVQAMPMPQVSCF